MQIKPERRSNLDRREATRGALIEAARKLFVEKGYAETGTPEIVAEAGLTRGALYHHFEDKQALFRAVAEQEAKAVAGEIAAGDCPDEDPRDALARGSRAFLGAMAEPGRTRLLLLEGPAVLGRQEMDAIDLENGLGSLKEGLAAAQEAGMIKPLPLDALTALLGAAFDRAALAIESGADRAELETTLDALIEGLGEKGCETKKAQQKAGPSIRPFS